MVLEDTSERRMCTTGEQNYHASIPLGLYVVRGDSMVLLGTLGDDSNNNSKEVSLEELEELSRKSAPLSEPLEWDFDTDLVA